MDFKPAQRAIMEAAIEDYRRVMERGLNDDRFKADCIEAIRLCDEVSALLITPPL
jgi:hypothetical protein